jgi:glutathione peroxidase-family protein
MKQNNVTKYDAILWNWSKNVITNDGIFIASYINSTITNEIRWPIIEERQVLATQLP